MLCIQRWGEMLLCIRRRGRGPITGNYAMHPAPGAMLMCIRLRIEDERLADCSADEAADAPGDWLGFCERVFLFHPPVATATRCLGHALPQPEDSADAAAMLCKCKVLRLRLKA